MQHFRSCALLARPTPTRRPGRAWRPRVAGISIIEVMVTVAIVGILLAIGVPSMQRFMAGRATAAQAEELASSLRLARSEALKLGGVVSVCATADTTAEAPDCSGEAAWATGWLTFTDANGDGVKDSGDRLLRVQSPVAAVEAIDSSDVAVVSFFSNGLTKTGAAVFEVKPKGDADDGGYDAMVRTVDLNTVGRVVVLTGPPAETGDGS